MNVFSKIKEVIFKVRDYDRLESDYCTCLCYFTNNKMSKSGYQIETVKSVIMESIAEYLNEGYEVAIENAIDWIKENAHSYKETTNTIFGKISVFNTDKLIADLRQAMKDVKQKV